MRIRALTAVLSLFAAASAVAEPCKTQGFADAKELAFDLTKQELRDGLSASIELGLQPPSFPLKEISKATAPCSRGTMTVGSDTFELFGENEPDDGPPRWTTSPTKANKLFFLALMPRPEAALTWATGKRPEGPDESVRFEKDEWMWALVALFDLRGDRSDFIKDRVVIALFDKIPTDDRLKVEIKNVAEGKRGGFLRYNGSNSLHRKIRAE